MCPSRHHLKVRRSYRCVFSSSLHIGHSSSWTLRETESNASLRVDLCVCFLWSLSRCLSETLLIRQAEEKQGVFLLHRLQRLLQCLNAGAKERWGGSRDLNGDIWISTRKLCGFVLNFGKCRSIRIFLGDGLSPVTVYCTVLHSWLNFKLSKLLMCTPFAVLHWILKSTEYWSILMYLFLMDFIF